jgi:hypothetical protein
MFRGFHFRLNRFIIGIVLIALGLTVLTYSLNNEIAIGDTEFTSIGILGGGLVFYAGVLTLISMFQSETVMSIALILPSIVAIAIFVYAFIGWSFRASISQWKGLNPCSRHCSSRGAW